MKKLLIAALPMFALLAGCTAEIDTAEDLDDEEIVEEDAQAITSFFSNGDTSSPLCADGTPIAKNPSWYNGRARVDAAGSCIMQGATMKLLVPFSVTQYGPYSMSFDASGTRLQTPSLGPSIMPAGSCRMVQITNPNGKVSSTPVFCR